MSWGAEEEDETSECLALTHKHAHNPCACLVNALRQEQPPPGTYSVLLRGWRPPMIYKTPAGIPLELLNKTCASRQQVGLLAQLSQVDAILEQASPEVLLKRKGFERLERDL